MKILLIDEERIRLEGAAGPLTIEAETADMAYSPFHMLASGLATCVFSVLYSWANSAKLSIDDLAIEVGWNFVDNPYRVGEYTLDLHWPSLPENRRAAAERAAHLCTVHNTFEHPPTILTRVKAA